jgi:hypothetical protein
LQQGDLLVMEDSQRVGSNLERLHEARSPSGHLSAAETINHLPRAAPLGLDHSEDTLADRRILHERGISPHEIEIRTGEARFDVRENVVGEGLASEVLAKQVQVAGSERGECGAGAKPARYVKACLVPGEYPRNGA